MRTERMNYKCVNVTDDADNILQWHKEVYIYPNKNVLKKKET